MAVLIEGPKWCGKTTAAEQIAGNILYMDDPQRIEQNIMMANLNPKRLLAGDTPRLIDEWQLAPKLWEAVRFEVDHRKAHAGTSLIRVIWSYLREFHYEESETPAPIHTSGICILKYSINE